MKIALSVIVCTYNREELLRLCLQSLAEQSLDSTLYEVVVVNNNSTRGAILITQWFTERCDNFRMVTEVRQGLSHARNHGWREARGMYVAFIDDDAKATPQWCERILEAFAAADPPPVAVGGKILPFYDATPPAWFSDDIETRSWGETPGLLREPLARFGFSGSNMAFLKSILEEFGGFSAELGMKGEATALGEETQLFSTIYAKYPRFWYDPQLLLYHWTPKRSMTVSYRLYRSFKGGEAMALIDKRRVLSRHYLLTLLRVLYFLAATPIALLTSRQHLQTAERRAEELAGKIGYLLGQSSTKST